MGSMLKFDSDRRELTRERRDARVQRKHERRKARQQKHGADRVVQAPAITFREPAASAAAAAETKSATTQTTAVTGVEGSTVRDRSAPEGRRPRRGVSRRERDIAAFKRRRAEVLEVARAEARIRISRNGEPASVADALAALHTPEGRGVSSATVSTRRSTAARSTSSRARRAGRYGRSAATRPAPHGEQLTIPNWPWQCASPTRSSPRRPAPQSPACSAPGVATARSRPGRSGAD